MSSKMEWVLNLVYRYPEVWLAGYSPGCQSGGQLKRDDNPILDQHTYLKTARCSFIKLFLKIDKNTNLPIEYQRTFRFHSFYICIVTLSWKWDRNLPNATFEEWNTTLVEIYVGYHGIKIHHKIKKVEQIAFVRIVMAHLLVQWHFHTSVPQLLSSSILTTDVTEVLSQQKSWKDCAIIVLETVLKISTKFL